MSFKLLFEAIRVTEDGVRKALSHPLFAGWKILQPGEGQTTFFSGQPIEGMRIQAPGWSFPIGVAPDGRIQYDDYHGRWGKVEDITKLAVAATAVKMGGRLDFMKVERKGDQVLYDFA